MFFQKKKITMELNNFYPLVTSYPLQSRNATNYSHVYGDAGVHKPTVLPITKSKAHAIIVVGCTDQVM